MESINIMATRHSAFYSPLLVTIAGGFLQQQGLEVFLTAGLISHSCAYEKCIVTPPESGAR